MFFLGGGGGGGEDTLTIIGVAFGIPTPPFPNDSGLL